MDDIIVADEEEGTVQFKEYYCSYEAVNFHEEGRHNVLLSNPSEGNARSRIASSDHISWNERFRTALIKSMEDMSGEQSRELALVSHDFNFVSEMYGKLIISEYFLPDDEKTIRPLRNAGGIAGGTKYLCR